MIRFYESLDVLVRDCGKFRHGNLLFATKVVHLVSFAEDDLPALVRLSVVLAGVAFLSLEFVLLDVGPQFLCDFPTGLLLGPYNVCKRSGRLYFLL
jgi:hypothetical protein